MCPGWLVFEEPPGNSKHFEEEEKRRKISVSTIIRN